MEIRILQPADVAVLANVAPEVFDKPIDPRRAAEFLKDQRHHLVVAIVDGTVVGFASGVHYVHPDKPPELWINELGVSPAHRGRGLGKAVLGELLQLGRRLGCREAWVLTDRENGAALAVYTAVGGRETEAQPLMLTFRLESIGTP